MRKNKIFNNSSLKALQKKFMSFAIPIIKKEQKIYAAIYHLNKSIININYVLFYIFKKELAKIFKFKK